MKSVTYGGGLFSKGHTVLTVNSETKEVVTSFTSSDYLMNAAHVHMTADEARKYAQQLIIYANKLDPIE